MGAALTYARRYALFTLAGIAGEDDLDAPDLCDGPLSPSQSGTSSIDNSVNQSNAQTRAPRRAPGNGRAHFPVNREPPIGLDRDQSAALRDKLLTEINEVTSADLATTWAQGALTAKNSLTAADATLVEESFERRLKDFLSPDAEFTSDGDTSRNKIAEPDALVEVLVRDGSEGKSGELDGRVDKNVLPIAAPRRYRNKDHLRFVAQQPCLLCGRKPSDPHHLRFTQPRALGRKVSDEFVVPLCRVHHRAVHRAGDERGWWKQTSIEPLKVARKFWKHTRVNEGRIRPDQKPHSAGSA